MFNWIGAIGSFSFVGMCVCAFFSLVFFDTERYELGAAFLVTAMILVFVVGGIMFA